MVIVGGLVIYLGMGLENNPDTESSAPIMTPAAGGASSGGGSGSFCGPAAKSFDWDHILSGHHPDGSRGLQSGKKSQFENMTQSQIKAAVMAAWKNRKLYRTQDNVGPDELRQTYQGLDPVSGYTIEMWFNKKTCEVETAYPVKVG